MMEDINLKRLTYQSSGSDLEGLLFVPSGEGKFPLAVFIHGHNDGSGAWGTMLMGYFLARAGYVGFLPSQIGYGLSFKGNLKPDFCGPQTVQGIIDGIKAVSNLEFVNSEKIGIWGMSRGATTASQVITKPELNFSAAVLQSGVYDMKKEYDRPDKYLGIKENMEKETGGTDEAWKERSSILSADKITAPVLILHGDEDKNVSVEQAKLLDARLKELGKEHEIVIIEGGDHYITNETRRNYTFPFLEKYLK